ncbi:hypothetical protein PMAYCL1PPCAC_03582, partial [Pristionchus mayeri]
MSITRNQCLSPSTLSHHLLPLTSTSRAMEPIETKELEKVREENRQLLQKNSDLVREISNLKERISAVKADVATATFTLQSTRNAGFLAKVDHTEPVDVCLWP